MDADNDNELPRTRAEAKALGSKRYFTGKPCKHGHLAERFTSSRGCVVCSYARYTAWASENPEHLREYRRNDRVENADKHKARWDEWYAANREQVIANKRERYQDNKEEHLAYAAEYRSENPELVRQAAAKWREANPDKVKQGWADWYAENGKERDKAKRSTPRGRLDNSISRAIYGCLKGEKGGRPWEAILGYSLDVLISHLERLFLPGMTWENYGEWHVDHIIPKAAFNYETDGDIDFHRCWALENLQPLWAFDNISKGAKLTEPFQPSLALGVSPTPAKSTT